MPRFCLLRKARTIMFETLLLATVVHLAAQSLHTAEHSDWPPEFYVFCMDVPAVKDPSIPAQADLLAKLGFDGAGYPLWFGEELNKNLSALDQAGLQLYLAYLPIKLNADRPALDPRLPEVFAKLEGRPTTVSVLLQGFPPGDPRGMKPAVKLLRQLGDLAADSNLRISIYHHLNNWTESLLFAIDVVEKVDHPRVGFNFNLCHWLKVDGDKDYRPVLRKHADKLFAVLINGARRDADTWTRGLIQPLDRGDFSNGELLQLLQQIGYDGSVGLMCFGIPDDTRLHLQRSMQVWKSWHAGKSK
ncbi:MAG: sugar phosphate isomerase/epimerase family protein [Planctomycetota bacterium]